MAADGRSMSYIVGFASVVTAIPAACMLIASVALLSLKISKRLESLFSYLAAGLILGAVS